jgi:hypothetical protein
VRLERQHHGLLDLLLPDQGDVPLLAVGDRPQGRGRAVAQFFGQEGVQDLVLARQRRDVLAVAEFRGVGAVRGGGFGHGDHPGPVVEHGFRVARGRIHPAIFEGVGCRHARIIPEKQVGLKFGALPPEKAAAAGRKV